MPGRYAELLTGAAQFTGDLACPGVLDVVYIRSPVAAAHIASIDTTKAAAADGVVAIYAGGDLDVLPVWEIALIPEDFAQPVLATDVVRYAGERVVAIVATSVAAGLDAAELVDIEYEPLVPVCTVDDATRPGAPALFAGREGNTCLAWESDQGNAPFPRGDVSVTVENWIPRVSVAPLEGHAVLAVPDSDGRLTVWVSTQVPTATYRQLVRSLQAGPAEIRVVAPNVGGGFGGKGAGGIADHMIVAAAARALGRPVRYIEDRAANLTTMQGRGVRNTVELHATSTGVITGVRGRIVCDAGAYPSIGAVEPGKTRMMMCGPYRIAHVDVDAIAVVTNLPPVGAYRGPGRAEASLMLERAVDGLAADLDVDPLDLRRQNVLSQHELPHATVTGIEYDSGDYVALLDKLEALSDYRELRAEQATRRTTGTSPALGLGIAMVVDSTAWFARTEGAAVEMEPDGTVVVKTGSAPAGQHHTDMYRAIVRSVLPIADAAVRVIEGDTGVWSQSDGSMGSRTAQTAGSAVLRATEELAIRLRELAATVLEAAPADVVFHADGMVGVTGVPARSLPFSQLLADAEGDGALEASCVHEQTAATYPSAAHLSVVEIDLETGRIVPVRHVAVTDCGTVLDPPSAEAQVAGACAQGIAQALYEEAVFDGHGNPLTTTFADYAIPSAAELPAIEAHFLATPTWRNPLGAKGVGEIGMVAAPVAVQNAVIDALRPFGVRHLDMPCTAEKVWASIPQVLPRKSSMWPVT
jgi:carbon-monoxide dehydrogenase large subunit